MYTYCHTLSLHYALPITPAVAEHTGDQAGGSGFAMGAGNRDPAAEPHQLGQHFGTRHHRDTPLVGSAQLRIVAAYRTRHHHHIDVGKIAGAVAKMDDCARSEEHTSELQSLMRNSYAVFCLK